LLAVLCGWNLARAPFAAILAARDKDDYRADDALALVPAAQP
jgi:hypothetical protein